MSDVYIEEWVDPTPDFHAIHQAFRHAEAEGYVSPNQMPVGTLDIDEVYAFLDKGVVSEPVSTQVYEPEFVEKPTSRKSNGHHGIGKTAVMQGEVVVRPVSDNDVEDDLGPRAALASFDKQTQEGLERLRVLTDRDLQSGKTQGYDWDERDGTQYFGTKEERDEEAERYQTDRERKREEQRQSSLRDQPYAKGFATKPTSREIAKADATLAWHSEHYRHGKPKPRKDKKLNYGR